MYFKEDEDRSVEGEKGASGKEDSLVDVTTPADIPAYYSRCTCIHTHSANKRMCTYAQCTYICAQIHTCTLVCVCLCVQTCVSLCIFTISVW